MAAALRQEVKDIVEAASRASLPDMAVVMAPINKGALRPPTLTQRQSCRRCHALSRLHIIGQVTCYDRTIFARASRAVRASPPLPYVCPIFATYLQSPHELSELRKPLV